MPPSMVFPLADQRGKRQLLHGVPNAHCQNSAFYGFPVAPPPPHRRTPSEFHCQKYGGGSDLFSEAKNLTKIRFRNLPKSALADPRGKRQLLHGVPNVHCQNAAFYGFPVAPAPLPPPSAKPLESPGLARARNAPIQMRIR